MILQFTDEEKQRIKDIVVLFHSINQGISEQCHIREVPCGKVFKVDEIVIDTPCHPMLSFTHGGNQQWQRPND